MTAKRYCRGMPVLAALPALPMRPTTTGLRPARWPRAGLLTCAVLLLHFGALQGLATPSPAGPPAATALQVRQIVQPSPAEQPTATVAADTAPPADRPVTPAVVPPAARVGTVPLPNPAPASGDEAASAPAMAPQVPTYATRPAAAATLVFQLRRGERTGAAELRWRPDDGRYRLELEATGLGLDSPGSASHGRFDSAGLAPDRYVDRRRGRDQRAVNFQREGGFISFSGPQLIHTLQPGAQDRLSWMLQLGAILQANPALNAPGAQISLWVAGARGESNVWNFTVQGNEALDLPEGHTGGTLKLLRRPERPFDTQIEVWLDPAREHLPVQLLMALRPGGQTTELRLQALSPP